MKPKALRLIEEVKKIVPIAIQEIDAGKIYGVLKKQLRLLAELTQKELKEIRKYLTDKQIIAECEDIYREAKAAWKIIRKNESRGLKQEQLDIIRNLLRQIMSLETIVERQTRHDMSRRKFIRQGAFVGLGAYLFGGNAFAQTRQIKDPHGYLRLLRDGEYVVPDNVIDTYSRITDPDIKKGFVEGLLSKLIIHPPKALYLIDISLDTEGKKQEFRNDLEKLGYSSEELNQYLTIFTTPDNIIIRESTLKVPIKEWLPHERFHKEVSSLSPPDYDLLKRVAEEMLNRYYSIEEAEKAGNLFDQREISIKRELIPKLQAVIRDMEKREQLDPNRISKALGIPLVENIDSSNNVRFSSEKRIDEFYPYLAEGKFKPRAEIVLRRDFPRAYYLFDEIRKRTLDIANYNPKLPHVRF